MGALSSLDGAMIKLHIRTDDRRYPAKEKALFFSLATCKVRYVLYAWTCCSRHNVLSFRDRSAQRVRVERSFTALLLNKTLHKSGIGDKMIRILAILMCVKDSAYGQ